MTDNIKQMNLYESLDDEWIKKFEEEDKKYEDFYKEDNYYINVHFIFINKENEIEKIKQEKFFLSVPNYIKREEIIFLLSKNSVINNKKFGITSLLKYNLILEPSEIQKFLNETFVDQPFFLTNVKNIDTLFFEKTISSFQDLNSLFFILYEKQKKTLDIPISKNHKSIQNIPNTKKIYIHRLNTRRKKSTRKNI